MNKNQTEYHEIEPNPSKDRVMPEGDNPSYWDEFIKFTLFFKASTEVLSNWAIETLGD
jgi:hypothetical protein